MDDAPVCRLIPGVFGFMIQISLMVISIGLLVLKKKVEVKYCNRTWLEFGLDSSKQILGNLWIHVLNIFFSVGLHRRHTAGDSCDWYWVNIVVDCTIGTAIEYAFFRLITRQVIPRLVRNPYRAVEYESGVYGSTWGEFRIRNYIKQLSVWILVCTIMKFTVLVLMEFGSDVLLDTAATFLGGWTNDPTRKLFVVMIATPLVMNSAQLWIIDNVIKRSERVGTDSLAKKFLA